MSGWIRVDIESTFAGWTSRLSAAEFGVWVKLCLVIKAYGRHGKICRGKLADHLTHAGTSLKSAEAVIGKSAGHIVTDVTEDTVTYLSFAGFNPDPTNANRQSGYREKHPNPPQIVTVVTERNGSNDDVTGRDVDVTGQDSDERTGAERAPIFSSSSGPLDLVCSMFERQNPGAEPKAFYRPRLKSLLEAYSAGEVEAAILHGAKGERSQAVADRLNGAEKDSRGKPKHPKRTCPICQKREVEEYCNGKCGPCNLTAIRGASAPGRGAS